MKILIGLILTIFISFSTQNDTTSEKNAKNAEINQDKLVIFNTEKTSCAMYTDNCQLNVLIKKTVENISKNLFQTTDPRTFTIESIQSCEELAENEINTNFTNVIKCPEFAEFKIAELTDPQNDYSMFIIKLNPGIVGIDYLIFHPNEMSKKVQHLVIISEPRRLIDILFDYYIRLFQILISFLMGILLDSTALFKLVKMPVPVAIGFISQYGIMPLVAFAFVKIVGVSNIEGLAIFIYGCSPGGSSSNNWTIIFNGDIDLSVLMTFVSTISSLFMMPAWIYTLGKVFTDEAHITIPFVGLLPNLLITIVPCVLGLLFSLISPKIKKFSIRIAKGFTLFIVITFLTALFVLKFYLFRLINFKSWLGFLIPWLGFVLGGSVARLFGLPMNQVKTIGIETGMQNFGVAFLIIMFNLPSPEKDYATLPLMAIAILTPLPFYMIVIYNFMVKAFKCCKTKQKEDENKNEEEMQELNKEMIPIENKV